MSDETYQANQHIDWLEKDNALDRETLVDWFLAVENESRLEAQLAEARAHVEALLEHSVVTFGNGAISCTFCGTSTYAENRREHRPHCPYPAAREWLEAQEE